MPTNKYHRDLGCPEPMPGRLLICPDDEMSLQSRWNNRPSQENSTSSIQLHQKVRQLSVLLPNVNDVISPQLTNALESVKGQYLSHLWFADDIINLAESLQDLEEMLNSLEDSSNRMGLGIVVIDF